jgi:HD superfamily phosphohydrolase YqeK
MNVTEMATAYADMFGLDSKDPRVIAALMEIYFKGVHDQIERQYANAKG